MSTKENKELIRNGIKEWNVLQGDAAKVRSLYNNYYAPSYIYHNVFRGDMNLEQTIQYIVGIVSAFPDLNFSIDDILAEGDKTVIRYTMKATHKGTLMGIPGTGKQIAVKGVEIDKIVGGKTMETWDFPDYMGMMTQLGVIPAAAPKK